MRADTVQSLAGTQSSWLHSAAMRGSGKRAMEAKYMRIKPQG